MVATTISFAREQLSTIIAGTVAGASNWKEIISYIITKNLSVGVGGRYWAMCTKKDSNATFVCCGGTDTLIQGPSLAKYSMERWGTFFQASYKFD
ncbi:hypothetical protein [Bradyrhizobium sp. 190]|uniref:hypothetical protein n=1 Tax=Bradyrhizobium sp. 190 TaxID=2782658 RepID=UPI001FF8967E|nr:hypothetical protein [Bradyrhizobium sp. 190]